MKLCKYEFTKLGIEEMYDDAIDEIMTALDGTNENFGIEDLDFKVTIGNLQIEIPCFADAFETLFGALLEIEEDLYR